MEGGNDVGREGGREATREERRSRRAPPPSLFHQEVKNGSKSALLGLGGGEPPAPVAGWSLWWRWRRTATGEREGEGLGGPAALQLLRPGLLPPSLRPPPPPLSPYFETLLVRSGRRFRCLGRAAAAAACAGRVQGGRAGGADQHRGAARLACGGWADQDRRLLRRGGDQGSSAPAAAAGMGRLHRSGQSGGGRSGGGSIGHDVCGMRLCVAPSPPSASGRLQCYFTDLAPLSAHALRGCRLCTRPDQKLPNGSENATVNLIFLTDAWAIVL